MSKKYTAY